MSRQHRTTPGWIGHPHQHVVYRPEGIKMGTVRPEPTPKSPGLGYTAQSADEVAEMIHRAWWGKPIPKRFYTHLNEVQRKRRGWS